MNMTMTLFDDEPELFDPFGFCREFLLSEYTAELLQNPPVHSLRLDNPKRDAAAGYLARRDLTRFLATLTTCGFSIRQSDLLCAAPVDGLWDELTTTYSQKLLDNPPTPSFFEGNPEAWRVAERVAAKDITRWGVVLNRLTLYVNNESTRFEEVVFERGQNQ